MTCIVALRHNKKIYVGGDRCGASTTTKTVMANSKVFKLDNRFVVGYTSSFRYGQLLQFHVKCPKQKPKQTDMEFMVNTFVDTLRTMLKQHGYLRINSNREEIGTCIVAYKGNMYEIQDDLAVLQHAFEYVCVGSGTYHAEGSLFTREGLIEDPKQRIIMSLQAASTFCPGVSGPYDIIKL